MFSNFLFVFWNCGEICVIILLMYLRFLNI